MRYVSICLIHAKGIIAIEDNKPEAIELLRDKVKDNDKIEVHVMKTKYPQGAGVSSYMLTLEDMSTPRCFQRMLDV